MTADELIQFLLPLPPDLKIVAGLPISVRDPGGCYNVIDAQVDKPTNSVILYVEEEDE